MSGNAKACFCDECGRRKGTGPGDTRWWVLMTIGGGLHVAPWAEAIAALTDHHACGDRCVCLMFARYVATGKFEKPRHPELPSYLPPYVGAAMYCATPNCGREIRHPASASALVHCPGCGGSTFTNQRPKS